VQRISTNRKRKEKEKEKESHKSHKLAFHVWKGNELVRQKEVVRDSAVGHVLEQVSTQPLNVIKSSRLRLYVDVDVEKM